MIVTACVRAICRASEKGGGGWRIGVKDANVREFKMGRGGDKCDMSDEDRGQKEGKDRREDAW